MGYIILFIISMGSLGVTYKWGARKVVSHLSLERNLTVDYPKSEYIGKPRVELKKRLMEFDAVFYRQYPHVKNDDFSHVLNDYPRNHSKQLELNRRIQVYEALNLENKAIDMLRKIVPLKMTIEEQIDYFKRQQLTAQDSLVAIDQEEFSSFFPQLYTQRCWILQAIDCNCVQIIERLQAENSEFEQAIKALDHQEKQYFLKKAGTIARQFVASSIRYVSNIVGGVADDTDFTEENETILVLSEKGVEISFDAIDELKKVDGSMDFALAAPEDAPQRL